MPADGWYVTTSGDELLVSGGAVKSDAVVTNESGQSRYRHSCGICGQGLHLGFSPLGYTYATASDGTITQTIAPMPARATAGSRASLYWSGAGAVKELLMNVHYSTGRFGQSISKIAIHHNVGNLPTETHLQHRRRAASAHYQVALRHGWTARPGLQHGMAFGQLDHQHPVHRHRARGLQRRERPVAHDGSHHQLGSRRVAALCLQYSLGRPQWGVNVVGHNECVSTECPASLAVGGSQHDEYITKAQEWYDKLSKI